MIVLWEVSMIGLRIQMPTGCDLCPCNSEGHCSALYYVKGEPLSLPIEYYSETKRYPDCPLVEVKDNEEVS
jgi:hypothetical protein